MTDDTVEFGLLLLNIQSKKYISRLSYLASVVVMDLTVNHTNHEVCILSHLLFIPLEIGLDSPLYE